MISSEAPKEQMIKLPEGPHHPHSVGRRLSPPTRLLWGCANCPSRVPRQQGGFPGGATRRGEWVATGNGRKSSSRGRQGMAEVSV